MNNFTASQILPEQSLWSHFTPLCAKSAQNTALVVLILLGFFSSAIAADFSGRLGSVSITDSAGTNKTPSAVITYTPNGKTFIFDATKSSDLDGSIVKYTWDFGDNTSQGSGLTATHEYTAEGSYNVSLTVIDDKGGVTISQSQVNASTGFTDDFNSDTSANYTRIGTNTSTGISITSGVAKGAAQYQVNMVLRGTTGNNNHYAQADIELATASTSGVLLGASAPGASSTGYAVAPYTANLIKLYTFSGVTFNDTGKSWTIPTLTSGTLYTMKVVKTGSSFALYLDTGSGLNHIGIDQTDSAYTTGSYVGLVFNQSSGYYVRADNFKGGL